MSALLVQSKTLGPLEFIVYTEEKATVDSHHHAFASTAAVHQMQRPTYVVVYAAARKMYLLGASRVGCSLMAINLK
jgi:hypothetical protein